MRWRGSCAAELRSSSRTGRACCNIAIGSFKSRTAGSSHSNPARRRMGEGACCSRWKPLRRKGMFMPDHATKEVLPANLQEHRAVKAWRKLQSEWFETDQIEILKLKTKSAVYRLTGAGPDGSAVIAKRCRTATAVVEKAIYDQFLTRLR